MKLFKAIFGNALVVATTVTLLAGAVLVAYAEDPSTPAAARMSNEAPRAR